MKKEERDLWELLTTVLSNHNKDLRDRIKLLEIERDLIYSLMEERITDELD